MNKTKLKRTSNLAVVLRNKGVMLHLFEDSDYLMEENSNLPLTNYNSDLTHLEDSDYDIVKIYKINTDKLSVLNDLYFSRIDEEDGSLIWERDDN